MSRAVRLVGLALTFGYGVTIFWLYVRQPSSFSELATQASVDTHLYAADREQLSLGIQAFERGDYRDAIRRLQGADPADKDPKAQFYVAYSYYLLGKGRLWDDDKLFQEGIQAIDKCIENSPGGDFVASRKGLEFRSAAKLRRRLQDGLEISPSDFNPLNWLGLRWDNDQTDQ